MKDILKIASQQRNSVLSVANRISVTGNICPRSVVISEKCWKNTKKKNDSITS